MNRGGHGAGRRAALAVAACGLVAALALAAAAQAPPAAGSSQHPLKPPDTSSPRATLRTFLESAASGWQGYLEGGVPELLAGKEAIRCLDLSKVPPAQRDDVGREAMLQLFDVFNRIELPPLAQVPDAERMEGEGSRRWVIPHTSIAIAKVQEGTRAGEWLFEPRVARRAGLFYELTRTLPLKPGAVVEDGYALYITQTPLFPTPWLAGLPEWTRATWADQTLIQWISMLMVLALGGLLAWAGVRWTRRTSHSGWRLLLGPLALAVIASATLRLLDAQLNITGSVLAGARLLLDSVFYLSVAWGSMLAGRALTGTILRQRRFQQDPLNAQVVRLGVQLGSFVVVALIVAVWLRSLGFPVFAVLTGLGVGGIAVALAAQTTVENFIGSLALFADRPVRVGDFCRFGDKMGTVERIGLRSTQIRTLERSLLSVPNAEFSRLQLDNLAERDRMLFRTTLNLRLETTPAQLERVLSEIQDLLRKHESVHPDPARVRLVAVGPLSHDLEIFAYVKTREMNEFLAIREAIYLRILRIVEEAGSALAPPAQTTYLKAEEPPEPSGAAAEEA